VLKNCCRFRESVLCNLVTRALYLSIAIERSILFIDDDVMRQCPTDRFLSSFNHLLIRPIPPPGQSVLSFKLRHLHLYYPFLLLLLLCHLELDNNKQQSTAAAKRVILIKRLPGGAAW